jgi:hypothetical protein
MFICEIWFVLGLIWGRPFDTPISFCVYLPIKNSITLALNKAGGNVYGICSIPINAIFSRP